jgi:hypothetical protein
MTAQVRDTWTRQARRMIARIKAWSLMSRDNALRDEYGFIIPRRIRRSMALTLAKRKVPA